MRRIQKLEVALSTPGEPERLHWQPGYRGWRKFPPIRPIQMRFGNLRRLPEEYRGERHVEIVKELPERNGRNWFEFAEVPGPDPNPPASDDNTYRMDILFIEPYPQPEP